MKKFIRNDYTFIKRLELLVCKYENMYHQTSINKEQDRYSEIHYNIRMWIKDIKEDMRLNALQKINDISLNVRGFTKEEADVYYAALDKIYKPLVVNINDIT